MEPDIILEAIIKCIIVHKDETETRIHSISDIVSVLQNMKPTTKINNQAFSVKTQKCLGMMSTCEKSLHHNNQLTRGFKTSMPFLMEKIRTILKDPKYQFENDILYQAKTFSVTIQLKFEKDNND